MENGLLVFDVGKTNKKLLVFDDDLNIVDSLYEHFDSKEKDGVFFYNMEEIKSWLFSGIKQLSEKYPIKAVSITTHGATWAAIGKDGAEVLPVIDYVTPVPDSFHDDFYGEMGSREELQKVTATPDIGALINPAKGLYFMKKNFPDQWENTAHILFYPQYFGYLLTDKLGAEGTYAGCHTYLYDFKEDRWSSVADKLNISQCLPKKIGKSWEILGTVSEKASKLTGLSRDVIVTMGIHDSNSSLLPYLLQEKEPFILNSTGTWCVPMVPSADTVDFKEDELGKTVFYNMSAFKKPVKTSIFMGGEEFDRYKKILDKLHGTNDFPDYDREIYASVIEGKNLFIQPSVVKGSGQFPDSPPGAWEGASFYSLEEIENGRFPEFFADRAVSFAVLRLSLAAQTIVAFRRAGFTEGMNIFVEGGFRHNTAYNTILASYYTKSRLYITNMKEATSFGAAILAKAALNGSGPEICSRDYVIDKEEIPRDTLPGLEEYVGDFLELINRSSP